jgi:cation transporter-like permease
MDSSVISIPLTAAGTEIVGRFFVVVAAEVVIDEVDDC